MKKAFSQEDIEKKVFETISKTLKVSGREIRREQKLEEICKDSIQIYSLIMALEKKFKRRARYEDLMRIETIEDVVNYVKKELESST